jgi:hypothetical protein
MTIDVRSVLDGKVWPQDPHDFVGDEVDILREQLARSDDEARADAADQVLHLLADQDIAIRARAVLALETVRPWLDDATISHALRINRATLLVTPPPMWQISTATLWDEAHRRLDLPRPGDGV